MFDIKNNLQICYLFPSSKYQSGFPLNMEKPGIRKINKKKSREKPEILNNNLKKPGVLNNYYMLSSKILI